MTTTDDAGPAIHLPERTGSLHDFDFLAGSWTVQNRTSKGTPDGSWIEFPAIDRVTLHLGGVMNVHECHFPTRDYSAVTIRIFDVAKRQWSIYWIEQRTGVLLPPMRGGFEGDRGEFYGEDDYAGKRYLCRFVWTRLDPDHARWEQSYSTDGQDWEVNWVMEFTRKN